VPKRLVINTGPLITLSRIACLDVVGQLPYQFICPEAVRLELDAGEASGYPRIDPAWLTVRGLSAPLPPVTLAALDVGEAAVIHLALELQVPEVAIDEWKGRRAALAAGLEVTGTLGLLGRAKRLGLVPALTPLIHRALREGIRYHPDLVRAVLRAVGEEDL
jgi:predicted nucleic acid-binding protein